MCTTDYMYNYLVILYGYMAQQTTREEAQKLRYTGKSIAEIATLLRASKSTVSYWCRDIPLTNAQQAALADRQRQSGAIGRLHAAESKRSQRLLSMERDMDRGLRDVGALTSRDRFMIGLALYWGEGYKSGNEECGLTNSDPMIIRAFIQWLKNQYGVPSEALILRVSINATHRRRVSTVEHYWSRMTGIPLSQFTSTSLIKSASKKRYENHEQHFGTLRIKVRKGTSLRRRIMGSLDALKQHFR